MLTPLTGTMTPIGIGHIRKTWTVVLQPDASTSMEARIRQNPAFVNTNDNAANQRDAIRENIGGFERRMLFQPDLSFIWPSATINNASFVVKCRTTIVGAATIDVHRLTQAWTRLGVTWNRYDGITSWATVGGDYAATIYASYVEPTAFTINTFYSFNVTTLVQEWVSGTFVNRGMLLKVNGATANRGLACFGANDATPANRPALTVTYTQ